jgi:predicted AAA+ superfamily ATPase
MIEENLILEFYKGLRNTLNKDILERELKIKEIKNKIIVIIGPRRAGKTYFLFQLMKKHKKSIYFDFENYLFKYFGLKEILETIKIYEQYFNIKVKYLFLDEIQALKDWQNILRSFENQGYKLFITGSSSKLLSKEIATQLRGRSLSYLLLPFSFREFLKAKGFKINKYFSLEEKVKIINHLKEYLNFGGFPEVVLADEGEKFFILKDYIDTIFFKDFIERFKIGKIEVAKFIFEFLLQNYSSEISVNKINNYVQQKLKENKKNLVYEYVDKLTDTFLVFFIEKFDFSIYKRKTWPKKVYLVDNGLSLPFRFNEDKGKLMENIVFLHLKRQENQNPFQEIYYYKTKNNKEIDFLVKNRNKIELIEVTYEFDEERKKKLIKAMEELKLEESLCITWDEEDEIKEKGKKIKLIPLWKWLLKN